MFSGPPLPLSPDLPLRELLAYAASSGTLGAWMRGCRHGFSLYDAEASHCRVLISPDLGLLLGRCSHIALREGMEPVVLEAERLIQWRTLQIVAGAPYLPCRERLKEIFPGAFVSAVGFQVPIQACPPEEVLAHCLTHGIRVAGTRIIYRVPEAPPYSSR
jgi:hypothetical protein